MPTPAAAGAAAPHLARAARAPCRGAALDLDEALERVAGRIEQALASERPSVSRLCAHVARYRGKMLRPRLALASGLACRGAAHAPDIPESLISAAAVVETIHLATLVHDDVLDDADLRRGAPTLSRLAGNEPAVVLGDYLIAAAYHLCAELDAPHLCRLVARVCQNVCAGEILQLDRRGDFSIDESAYFEIIERKTGGLTGLACRLGAAVAGADDLTQDRLDGFGRLLGAAFQVQDDILDLTSSRSALGKPAHQDIAEGKITLPIIHHLARAGPALRRRTLDRLDAIARHATDPADLDFLARALESTGSVAGGHATPEGLARRAAGELDAFEPSPPVETLRRLAFAAVDRRA
jgi:octaprenyl-diphosphate synthase